MRLGTAIGSYGVLMVGLAPLLLGALAEANRLAPDLIGLAAMSEMLAMALGASLAGLVADRLAINRVAFCASLMIVLADVAMLDARGPLIVTLRAIAGVPSGVLIGIASTMIAGARQPDRWTAIFLLLQTLAQALLALALGLLVPRWGADSGFVVLAGLGLSSMLASLRLPARIANSADDGIGIGWPDFDGWIALLATAAVFAGVTAIFVVLGPLSRAAGLSGTVAGFAVAGVLVGQVAGCFAGARSCTVYPWHRALYAALAMLAATIAMLCADLPAVLYLAWAAAMGFCWMAAGPFLTAMAIDADPRRHAARMVAGAMLLGGACGALSASLLTSGDDVRRCGPFALACLVVSACCIGLRSRTRRRIGPPALIIEE